MQKVQALGKAQPRVKKQTPVCDLINVVEVHHTMRDINSACNLQRNHIKVYKTFSSSACAYFQRYNCHAIFIQKTYPNPNKKPSPSRDLESFCPQGKGKWKPEFD
jgi:hypothetical protein